jgi:sugar/nucleoside kinase (ribokinase family)
VIADTKLPNFRFLTLEDIRDSLPDVDYITPNGDEARYYTGKAEPEAMADVFLGYGVKNVIIKLGAEGCLLKNRETALRLPALPVCAVDATGAGDHLVAGFTAEILRGASPKEALRFAKERGVIISYDPHYRAALWDTEENAVAMMKKLLPLADILKVSDEEMLMLTGTEDFEEGSLVLSGYGPRLVLVTLGSQGVFVRYGEYAEVVPGFRVKVADTNGAGDTFLGAMLAQIAARGEGADLLCGLNAETLRDYLTYANKAASLTCSRHGAIPAMPTAEEMGK